MGLLDAYDTFVNNKCKELTQQNNTVEKLTESAGLSNLVGGLGDFISKEVVESLENSPLRNLSEDVLAQTIKDNARKFAQNLLQQAEDQVTRTLTDIRSTAFSAVVTTLTFKNDLVLYFASTVAEEAVEAIRDKRRTLIALQEAVRKLHNALLVLSGGGPIFADYLADIRRALILLDKARLQLNLTSSAFRSTTIFPTANFNESKELLQEAYELLLPEPSEDTNEIDLNLGFLKAKVELPSFDRQLSMLQTIPRLAKEMLGAYDLYAAKVIKVNALLLGFQSVVQNLQEVSGGSVKDTTLGSLSVAIRSLDGLIKNMAQDVNGDQAAINGPIGTARGPYSPNPTKTSSRALEWAVRVKVIQGSLATVDPSALDNLAISNNALRVYNEALEALSKIDDRRSATALLQGVDGREEIGDIEGDLSIVLLRKEQLKVLTPTLLLPSVGKLTQDYSYLSTEIEK
jgi:hypothetical protein